MSLPNTPSPSFQERWYTLSRQPFAPWLALALAASIWTMLYVNLVPFWDWLLYDFVNLSAESRWGSAVHFFFYDTSKILLLLTGMIFVITVLRSFFSVERTRALLGGKRQSIGSVLAALLGGVTPFCSCSSVPVFIGFVAAGVPLGVTLSFLIASPLINEVAIVLLIGLFGWQVTLLYVVTGLSIAIVAGWILGKLGLERYVASFVYDTPVGNAPEGVTLSWADRFDMGVQEVRDIISKIFPYLLVGIGIGAAVHGWVPADLLARYAGAEQVWAVPAAVLMGIPLYSNAAGILPLIEALHAKGVALGTLLSFMMAVVALSLPELILLRRVLAVRLIVIFVAVVAVGILTVGFLFNALL
jgi:uncharacterized membrane protein YraQ (UPF0718 family)